LWLFGFRRLLEVDLTPCWDHAWANDAGERLGESPDGPDVDGLLVSGVELAIACVDVGLVGSYGVDGRGTGQGEVGLGLGVLVAT
jgi:hypothetical protein